MHRRFTLVTILIFLFTYSFTQVNQYGIPNIVNYPPGVTNGSEQNWTITQDKRGVIYAGNHVEGILEYDGIEWRTIPVPNNVIRSLDCDDNGTIYVGGVAEIGYLAPDATGNLNYKSLVPLLDSADRSFYDVWKTYCLKDKIIFHSQKMVMVYYPDSSKFDVYRLGRHALLGFYANDNYYVGTFNKGLMVLEDSLVPAKGGDFFIEKNIFGLTAYDENHLLIGAIGAGLNLFNTETGEINTNFADPATNRYFNEYFMYHLETLSNGDFLASTNRGGLVVISHDGRIKEIISKNEGLQEQIIYNSFESTLYYPYAQVWSAMDIGVGRIDLGSPLRQFNEDNGFQGLIHTIQSVNGQLIIGTAAGIFAMNNQDDKAVFNKLGDNARPIWNMISFESGDGSSSALAIGDEGLFKITANHEVINLKNEIQGNISEEDRVFWGYSIYSDPVENGLIYLGRLSSITALHFENGAWHQEFAVDSLGNKIRSLARDGDKLWFASELSGLGYLSPVNAEGKDTYFDERHGLPSGTNNSDFQVFRIGEEILFGTIKGIYRVVETEDSLFFEKDTIINPYLLDGQNGILNIYMDPSKCIWVSYNNSSYGWSITALMPDDTGGYNTVTKPFFKLENFSTDVFHSMDGSDVWFSRSNVLFHYDKSSVFNESDYRTLIRKVTVNEDTVIYNGAYPKKTSDGSFIIGDEQMESLIPSIKYSDNNVEFRWSAPYFVKEKEIEFSYFLEGFSDNWSTWENVYYQDFTNLPQGTYTFRIKSRNVYRDESLEDSFSFTIMRPWYLTFYAFLFYLVATVFAIFVIIKIYTRRLKNENIRLEGIIQERTAEIRKQKEELTDSIEYASRIQRALLPPEQMLVNQNLDHFILFRPRDIVSGDFYWFGSNREKIFIVAADCTGHGVPGAFMSMLGISFLEEIVIKSGMQETNKILDALRNHVITSLRQTGKSIDESTKDGMDLAMVAIDQKTKEVQFSGAYNPLYIVRKLTGEEKRKLNNGEELDLDRGTVHNDKYLLFQIKADHMPIGISEKDLDFTASNVNLADENTLYLFSDGYVDQFGGPSGKKFMSKNFKKLLLEIQDLTMGEQREKLNDSLMDWMGNISQIDDILVIGVKIHLPK